MVGVGVHIVLNGGYDALAVYTSDLLSRVSQTGVQALLVNACNTGSAGLLSSVFAFGDFNAYLAKGTPADTTYALLFTQQMQRLGLYQLTSLVNPCVNGGANILYTLKP